jgi:hypothetical protein
LAEKLEYVWEKKNAKAARAGGVSLMALSLAACGSSDTTTTATTSTETTTTTVTPVSSNFTTSIDSLTGTTGADTYSGDSNTVSGADSVNGGDGTDTVKLYGVAATGLPNLTSVEALELHNVEPGDVNLSSASLTTVTSLTLDGFTASGENVTIKAGDSLALSDVTGGGDVDIEAAATVTSTTIAVDSSGASGANVDLDINGTGITTVNIDVSGTSKSWIDVTELAAVTSVDIDASTAVNVAGVDNAKTIDASGSTAAVTIASVGAADATVTLGSGDDSLDMGTGLSALDVLTGGTGTDTLTISSSITTATGTVTGFEIVEAAESGGAAVDIDGDAFSVTHYAASGTNFSTATFSDMASGNTYDVKIADATANATDTLTISHKTDGTADSVTLNFGSATVQVNVEDVIANDAETVTMSLLQPTADTDHDIENLTLTDATSVTVSGAGDTAITGINLKDAAHTFDASASTGDLSLTFEDVQSQTIKTGSGKDAVTLAANSLDDNDSIDLGAGLDTLTVATMASAPILPAISNVETVNLGFDNGTAAAVSFSVASMSGLTTLTIDGHGTGDTGIDQALTISGIATGTTVQISDDIDSDTLTTLNVAAGVSALTVNLDDFGDDDTGDNDLTIDADVTALTIATKAVDTGGTEAAFIGTLTASGATSLALSVGTGADKIDIDTLTGAALTSLTFSSKISGEGLTIDASTTDNSLLTIDTTEADTGVNGQVDVVLGSAASVIDRADTATVTMGTGDDTLSFNVNEHGGNVINMGANSTTSITEAGDNLVMGGTQSADFVVDLSSATDQVTTINGTANTAVQKNIESFDASALTYSAGKFTVTGSSVANTIKTAGGADIINGGAGADVIDAGAGADIITGGTGADVITAGTGVDKFIVTAGDATVTIGGSGNSGTLTGAMEIKDMQFGDGTLVSEEIDVGGTASVLADATTVNGTDSTLTIGGTAIKSHAISTGVVVFDDADNHGGTVAITNNATIAAAIQYLQLQDLGNAGSSLVFDVADNGFGTDAGSVVESVLFVQGDNAGTDSLDQVIFIHNSDTAAALAVTNATTSDLIFIS